MTIHVVGHAVDGDQVPHMALVRRAHQRVFDAELIEQEGVGIGVAVGHGLLIHDGAVQAVVHALIAVLHVLAQVLVQGHGALQLGVARLVAFLQDALRGLVEVLGGPAESLWYPRWYRQG